MEVPFPSFPIAQVAPMIKIKTEGTKNKVFKPNEAVRYLTCSNTHIIRCNSRTSNSDT
jgi:hypothetical protein